MSSLITFCILITVTLAFYYIRRATPETKLVEEFYDKRYQIWSGGKTTIRQLSPLLIEEFIRWLHTDWPRSLASLEETISRRSTRYTDRFVQDYYGASSLIEYLEDIQARGPTIHQSGKDL
jgi:hypothetical protein